MRKNTDLTYYYTQYHLNLVNDSINRIDIKNGFSILFNLGILAINQQNQNIVILILSISSALIAIAALFPQKGGGMTPPRLLFEEHWEQSDEYCKIVITKTWFEALDELNTIRDKKSQFLKLAYVLLGISLLIIML